MVFCHVRAWNEYHRCAKQAEFAYGACSGTAYHKVGSLVCSTHIADEVCDYQVFQWFMCSKGVHYCLVVVFACLPYNLCVSILHKFKIVQYAVVDGSCSQATSYEENGLLVGFQPERPACFLFCLVVLQYVLPYWVASHYYFLFRKKSFHPVVCNTYFACFLCKKLIGYTCVGVLFLNKAWYSHLCAFVQRRTTCVAAYSDCHHRPELLDYLLCHVLALQYSEYHSDVLQQMLSVEAAYRQTFYFRYKIHTYSSLNVIYII